GSGGVFNKTGRVLSLDMISEPIGVDQHHDTLARLGARMTTSFLEANGTLADVTANNKCLNSAATLTGSIAALDTIINDLDAEIASDSHYIQTVENYTNKGIEEEALVVAGSTKDIVKAPFEEVLNRLQEIMKDQMVMQMVLKVIDDMQKKELDYQERTSNNV
ncbi:MAG: hypothetical protein AB8B67_02095, partial [Rickettsiaceae bacterium]